MPSYGDASYWDERYSKEACYFDWYQGYSGLQPLLARHFPPEGALLQVGVGTSKLQEDMVQAGGYRRIVNLDISGVAVEAMQQLHRHLAGQLEYRVGDARSMPEFEDGCFDGVLDKGTLDAIVCGAEAADNAARMLGEVARVLRPGRPFMLVTYGDPSSRLPYLLPPQLGWLVDVYIMGKQEQLGLLDVAAAWSAGGGGAPPIKGPYRADDSETMDALSKLHNVHFVYVCTKMGADNAAEQAARTP